jgi:hypothetical protein
MTSSGRYCDGIAGCAIGAGAAVCSKGGVFDVQAASASAAMVATRAATAQICKRNALIKISPGKTL